MTKTTTSFDPTAWAKSITEANKRKGELDMKPELQAVLTTLLEMRADGKTKCSLQQILDMLQQEYGFENRSLSGLRLWLRRNMSDLYNRAGFNG